MFRLPSRFSRLPGVTLALTLVSPLPLAAQPAERATVLDILDGPELYIDQIQARVKQQARSPQVIATGRSRGQLQFNSGAVGRMNRDSQIRLGSSCFLLGQGEVLISGKQSACTRSARLSVRGTNYVLGLNPAGETSLSVLQGSIGVEPLRDGLPVAGMVNVVTSGQRLELSPSGEVLALSRLQDEDYAAFLNGPLFVGFATSLPDQEPLNRYLQQFRPAVLRNRSAAGSKDAESVARLRALLSQVRQLNRDLDRREGRSGGADSAATADPRTETWRNTSCGQEVQAYTASLAKVYRDWSAPKPSRKGHYVTRVDFDVYAGSDSVKARAANFEITQRSGEAALDRSAYAEAQRKSSTVPAPPACVGDKLRVYHRFVVDYF